MAVSRNHLWCMLGVLMSFVFAVAVAAAATGVQADPPADQDNVQAVLGTHENPVRVDSPRGQHFYLGRLRCPEGHQLRFHRVGNFGVGGLGNIVDGYEVACACGDVQMIYLDMYHTGYQEEQPVPGFRITSLLTPDLELRDDGLLYTWDAAEPYEGEFVEAYDSGEPRIRFTAEAGRIEGRMVRFYENGQESLVTTYRNGLRHGEEVTYYDTGELQSTMHYVDGQLHGEARAFRKSGELAWTGTRVEGNWHGEVIIYYEGGQIEERRHYAKGVMHGDAERYHANGNLHQSGRYEHGRKVGLWAEWDEQGNQINVTDHDGNDKPAA